jgi:hypothetical protein
MTIIAVPRAGNQVLETLSKSEADKPAEMLDFQIPILGVRKVLFSNAVLGMAVGWQQILASDLRTRNCLKRPLLSISENLSRACSVQHAIKTHPRHDHTGRSFVCIDPKWVLWWMGKIAIAVSSPTYLFNSP